MDTAISPPLPSQPPQTLLFLSYSYHTYETRNKISIRTSLFKLQFSKRSIFDHGIKIWNNHSPEVKSITNKRIFKKMIRKKLINEK